jgi:hypothetical protein
MIRLDNRIYNPVTLIAILCCVSPLTFPISTTAQIANKAQVIAPHAVFSLSSPTTFMAGEPILLEYELQNQSDKLVVGNLGGRNEKWYSLKLVDEDGKSATPKKVLDSEAEYGFRIVKYLPMMSPGEIRNDTIVVTKYFDIPHPGKWTLTASTQMSVAAVPVEGSVEKTIQSVDRKKVEKEKRNSVSQETKIELTVLPARSARLRTVAENLKTTVLTDTDMKRRRRALDSLTSMPEREAWPVWEMLSRNVSKSYASQVAIAMGQVASKHSADILSDMHEKKQGGVTPGIALTRMYQQTDGELKEYIESILRKAKATNNAIGVPQD